MARPHLDLTDDIQPISAFRANAAGIVKQVQTTGRPVVITQHGQSAAVLLDVQTYQDMAEELETLQEIAEARTEYSDGQVIEHADLMSKLRARASQ
jgi:antitoxin YefM